MAYGLSNGHVTFIGQTRDPNTFRAQYLQNYSSYRLQIWYTALYVECQAGTHIIFPESRRGLDLCLQIVSLHVLRSNKISGYYYCLHQWNIINNVKMLWI